MADLTAATTEEPYFDPPLKKRKKKKDIFNEGPLGVDSAEGLETPTAPVVLDSAPRQLSLYFLNRARAWIKRARDTSLDVQIVIAHLMKQTRSLVIAEEDLSEHLVNSVLTCWYTNGAPGTLKRLRIRRGWNTLLCCLTPVVANSVP
ncbi:hypothetical protein BDV93DRAFT_552925 [Ceratobasidium sp. AG-I]|nr:hypothetical protein BDV93DRAFT_552925 [Ceratobasidium sp. AG-I]